MMTIMIGKMDSVFPDMYMTKRFWGTCLIGPRARSQDLLFLRLAASASFCRLDSAAATEDELVE